MSERAGTILVVDDNEAERYYVARVLRKAGFEVTEAGTGQEALRLAGEVPDLVTLDVRLPDLSGFEVCRRLKADLVTRDIPVSTSPPATPRPTQRPRASTAGPTAT